MVSVGGVECLPSGQNGGHGVSASSDRQAAGFDLPTIVDIKRTIPRHCFEPSLSLSLYYVLKDLLIVAGLYFCCEWLASATVGGGWPYWLLTAAYWLLQGTVLFSVFVLGHDCGHGSFSVHPAFNDLCGTVLHSVLLVPYYAWKISHRNHHKNTGNFEKDEVFYPVRQEYEKERILLPGFGLGFGWFIYLLQGYYPRRVFHFNPRDPLFRKHFVGCTCSLLGLVVWVSCLCLYCVHRGLAALTYYYLVPVLVYASWLVIFTFLHHNDVDTPWYADKQWCYVRGQLSSVDRDYGWAHGLTHNIGTHQVHHLFPQIPHYYLEEATIHFRKAFPHLVRVNNDAIIPSFIRMFIKFKNQSFVSKDTLVHAYK